jgi:hypothetical protein
MGVLFFLVNCIFAIVILLMVMWTSFRALTSKNPDTRYQPMRDDRGSFIKSNTNLGTTELDALGATARGEPKPGSFAYSEQKRMDLEDDYSSSTLNVHHANTPTPISAAAASRDGLPRSASPYGPPSGPGYASPYAGRNPTQYRAEQSSSPANMWHRGVGY